MRLPRTAGAALLVAAVLGPLSSRAEEGGTGHYTPGSSASLIDAFPGRPGISVTDWFLFNRSSAQASLPVGGMVTATFESRSWENFIAVLDRTDLGLLGGNYAFGAVFPVLWLDMSAAVVAVSGTRSTNETASGIGDMLLYPAILGWTAGDLRYDVRLGIYAPTGKFEAGSIASVSKNYWTFEPAISVSYLASQNGFEASLFAAADFNTRNETTDYLSGDQFHADLTLARRFALGDGLFGVGASGFWYQQFTGDSGSGAVLGELKARTAGAGPLVSYAMKFSSGADGIIELKWLPELSVENRLKGHFFWLKFGAVF